MKRLKAVVSKVMGLPAKKVNDETSPHNVKRWDSLHGLLLLTEIENSYGLKFTMEDIVAIRNVGDIKKALKRYGIVLEEE